MRLAPYVLALVFLIVACAPSVPYIWVRDLPASTATRGALRVGDKVQLAVHGQPTMSGEFEVRLAGELVLPEAGRVMAGGLTVSQLQEQIRARLAGLIQNPQVTVVLVSRRSVITALGEVGSPGSVELRDDDGVIEALAKAGGFTPFADEDHIYVIPHDRRNIRVRFRYQDLVRGEAASIGYVLGHGDILIVE
jgi:polysaccharide export outer membrane protein